MSAKVRILFGLSLLFLPLITLGQDIVFNHPYAAMIYNNPSYTGIHGNTHASATFRSQYSATAYPYTTYYADFDTFIEKWNSGFGLYIMNDRAASGQFKQTAIALSYVYAFQVSQDLKLRPSIQAIYHNRHRHFDAVTFPDMLDVKGNSFPSEVFSDPYDVNFFDFSAGILAEYKNLEIGVSVHHLGAKDEGEYSRHPLKTTVQGKYIIPLQSTATNTQEIDPADWLNWDDTKLIPYVRYIYQKNYQYLTAGILLQTGALFAGGGIKTTLDQKVTNIAVSIGFMSSTFRVGYSMDFIGWGSSLSGWQGVSHEAFIHFNFWEDTGRPANPSYRKYRSKSCFGCYL
jgi:type IX secretion system PorP/SprF family membrane protein